MSLKNQQDGKICDDYSDRQDTHMKEQQDDDINIGARLSYSGVAKDRY